MKDVCTIAEPLWKLTKAGVTWKWGDAEQKAFDKLKSAITMNCASYFNKDWRTVVTVDASPVGLQYDPGNRSNNGGLVVSHAC